MPAQRFAPFALRLALACASCVAAAPAVAAEGAPLPPFSPGDTVICADAARAAERKRGFPLAVLRAIGIAESGRWHDAGRATIAWPWTVTAGGEGRFFTTKAAAIAHVRSLRRNRVRNIDVGCMQVNLMYHPGAFESLEAAFDPGRNAAYAGQFLARLYDGSRSWSRAVALYHSASRGRGRAYWRRVKKLWNAERSRLFEHARQSRIRASRARLAARNLRAR